MSTVNKASLRDEFDRIKTEFQQLMNKKKAPAEYIVLFQGMLTLMELLVSIFLEKQTKKNSKNSSKPSSQTDKDESSLTNAGSKSKGKNESKATASNMRVKESVTVSQVQFCNVCGKDLSDVPCQHHERRTKIDIIFEKVVEHTDAEIKECPDCDSVVTGTFPADMPGPLQYGNGIKAYIINLLVCQMISLNRAQKLVKAMIGTIISEATMLKFILRLYLALEDWEKSAKTQLLAAQAINVDETSLRVDKKNHWIHVYSSGDITLKYLHRKRGIEAIEDIDIIPRYNGTIIHDCWASYLAYCNCDHGLCGSHLTRELVHIIESNQYAWATNMKRLLLETCKKVSKSKRKKLTKKAYANLQKRYRNIITRGENEMPAIPPKPNGKKGKIAKSDAHNLLERLKEYEASVLLFARNSNVSFTNNRAERDLRMSKVKQKISGCFRKELYAKAYCRISSYLQTMANKGYNPLIAIKIALDGAARK
jgi:transposase